MFVKVVVLPFLGSSDVGIGKASCTGNEKKGKEYYEVGDVNIEDKVEIVYTWSNNSVKE